MTNLFEYPPDVIGCDAERQEPMTDDGSTSTVLRIEEDGAAASFTVTNETDAQTLAVEVDMRSEKKDEGEVFGEPDLSEKVESRLPEFAETEQDETQGESDEAVKTSSNELHHDAELHPEKIPGTDVPSTDSAAEETHSAAAELPASVSVEVQQVQIESSQVSPFSSQLAEVEPQLNEVVGDRTAVEPFEAEIALNLETKDATSPTGPPLSSTAAPGDDMCPEEISATDVPSTDSPAKETHPATELPTRDSTETPDIPSENGQVSPPTSQLVEVDEPHLDEVAETAAAEPVKVETLLELETKDNETTIAGVPPLSTAAQDALGQIGNDVHLINVPTTNGLETADSGEVSVVDLPEFQPRTVDESVEKAPSPSPILVAVNELVERAPIPAPILMSMDESDEKVASPTPVLVSVDELIQKELSPAPIPVSVDESIERASSPAPVLVSLDESIEKAPNPSPILSVDKSVEKAPSPPPVLVSVDESVETAASPAPIFPAPILVSVDESVEKAPSPAPVLVSVDESVEIAVSPTPILVSVDESIEKAPSPAPVLVSLDESIERAPIPSPVLVSVDESVEKAVSPTPILVSVDESVEKVASPALIFPAPILVSVDESVDKAVSSTPILVSVDESVEKAASPSPVLVSVDESVEKAPSPPPVLVTVDESVERALSPAPVFVSVDESVEIAVSPTPVLVTIDEFVERVPSPAPVLVSVDELVEKAPSPSPILVLVDESVEKTCSPAPILVSEDKQNVPAIASASEQLVDGEEASVHLGKLDSPVDAAADGDGKTTSPAPATQSVLSARDVFIEQQVSSYQSLNLGSPVVDFALSVIIYHRHQSHHPVLVQSCIPLSSFKLRCSNFHPPLRAQAYWTYRGSVFSCL